MKILSLILVLSFLTSCIGGGNVSTSSKSPISSSSCVLIDTDYDIDDMMAIPLVIGNKYVAGIITSEGYTNPKVAASALRQQIPQAGQREIPIIVGSSYLGGGHRDISAWPWIPYYRDAMGRINNLLPKPVIPAADNPNYVQDVLSATSQCSQVSVLIIGTFSSFINYSPAIQSKINNVVIMGRPLYPSRYNRDGSLNYSFNCEYDLASCKTAFTQVQNMNPVWVDVPRPPKSEPQYRPSLAMVNGLDSKGLPNELRKSLLSNLHTWDFEKMQVSNGGPGGNSLMWDQSAALYMVHPEAYSQQFLSGGGGKYWTPNLVTPEQLNRLWTNSTNKAVKFYQ